MTFDEALEVLERQGLASVRSTPRHRTPRPSPRWRVLCALATEMAPGERGRYMGRLNGLFRGIFADESWTLSQGYFFGSVNGNPSHRVEVIDGEPIDAHDDLDEIWLGKSAGHSERTHHSVPPRFRRGP